MRRPREPRPWPRERRHGPQSGSRGAWCALIGFAVVCALAVNARHMLRLHAAAAAEREGGLLEAWDKMPFDGKQAIVAAVGGIESVFEAQKPHYVMGGTPGKVRLTGTTKGALEDKYDAATLKKKRDMELANGRLAMLGMAGFVSARLTEGSVPALTKLGFAADYSGNLPYAPF